MGIVYRAHQIQLKRDVAIKVLRTDGPPTESSIERFMREAESAARLDHDNCLRVYDYGVTEDGIHYMVMPVLKGQSLSDALDGKRLAPRRAAQLAIQLFAGLEHAHAANVIHRDLKPDNLFLTQDEHGEDHLTIVDFGIAKILEHVDAATTTAGLLYGTPAYMSPEQAAGDKVDGRSDLFSAGLLLYRLSVGDVPARAKSALEQMRKRATQEVPVLPEDFPELWREFIAKLCALHPDDRFPTATAARLFAEQMLERWDAEGQSWTDLIALPEDAATRVDMHASHDSSAMGAAASHDHPLASRFPERPRAPAGPRWLGWAAGAVALASLGLAWRGIALRNAEESDTNAAESTAPPVAIPAVGLNSDAPAGSEDDQATPDGDAGSGAAEAATGTELPAVAPEANTLTKLAEVNQRDPARALPYEKRHRLLVALEADPQARPLINQRVNLAMDLFQAADSPTPCATYGAALSAVEATRDPLLLDALEASPVPTDADDPACEVSETRRAKLLASVAASGATGTTESLPSGPKSGPKSGSKSGTKTSKKTRSTGSSTGASTAGAVIEKLDDN